MSAWGKKPSLAIRQGPAPTINRQVSTGSTNSMNSGMAGNSRRFSMPDGAERRSSNSNNNNNRRGSYGGRGGGGRQGRNNNNGGGNAGRNNRKNNKPKHEVFQLNLALLKPGDGKTLQQTSVMRRTADHLLSLRLNYLDPPSDEWDPPVHCAWKNEEERHEEISKIAQASRQGGDVSQNNRRRSSVKETAPPLEECKPLEVNNETRWKAKVFEQGDDANEEKEEEELSDDEILKKALLILNKLSLTKFEKLSNEFVATGIARSKKTMEGAVGIVVDKAQSEPHFSSMYAQLCFKLSKKATVLGDVQRKAFRKLLLTRCQKEFEQNQTEKITAATEGLTDDEEIAYKTGLVKKAYLGHMRFIGELYKGDMIKLEIMLWCLKNLLENYEEERMECFTKLMTTIGYPLEQQSNILAQTGKTGPQKELHARWKQVQSMISGGEVSNRMKFMLLDLVEMRDKGWVKRREEETAKTLDQVHWEVEMEERKAQSRRQSTSSRNDNRGLRRSTSMSQQHSKPQQAFTDSDGFTTVMPTSRSSNNLMRSASDATGSNPGKMRRAQSMNVMGSGMPTNNFRILANANNSSNNARNNSRAPPVRSKSMGLTPTTTIAKASSPPSNATQKPMSRKEVASKVQALLKEFFAVNDKDDALLSVEELINAAVDESGRENHKKLIVESSILFVLERKQEDVEKAIDLLLAATMKEPSLLRSPDFVAGLCDPLEFLSDIEIDAPKAGDYMALILFKLFEAKLVELESLLTGAPEYFLSDGKPAHLAGRVLLLNGTEITDGQLDLVEKLMTDRDKGDFASPKAIIESLQKK